ncbi:5921_t:CDS:2 [Paraglomus brasilianum]|uniref:5921_t:CDS:1 n=1 Tax=Paraglomus brasilianum TaxID=144538 RepID=A0A9N9DSU0_9GLOM|nr:5921_t:CDS:2 [Paraglomus brasilianum]
MPKILANTIIGQDLVIDSFQEHYKRVMEALVLASKYRKNYRYNHATEKIVDGKRADIVGKRMWGTGEEIFVGEQAGPPSQSDLTKSAMDSAKPIMNTLE